MYRRGSTEISSHVHCFQDEEEATNAMLSFFSTAALEVTKKTK